MNRLTMIPVYQTVISKGRGNCHQALIASIFELDLSQVPNFRLFPENKWFDVYYYFLWAMGFKYKGQKHNIISRPLLLEDSLNGFFDAAVESRTLGPDVLHAVILDVNGIVVHDPNPNKRWLGVDVITTNSLKHWYIFDKIK